jgi:TonB-linked SusC/RagA family outer membrane protein
MNVLTSKNLSQLKLIVVVCLLFVFNVYGAAQNITIKGTVTDNAGEPLPGVSIVVSGSQVGTVTALDGAYTIPVPDAESVLQFSYIGYVSKTVKVGSQRIIDVSLSEDLQALDEVVVVGYGVQKKSDLTGALGFVTSKDLTTKPVSNVFEAMQGKVAGVDITSAQRPGELGSIRIRGERSLGKDDEERNKRNSPLYVVDGVILSSGGIESLNPYDIESISILKDASSTAIYGSRGANGVVLVTTKRGKTGALQLNYSGALTCENLYDMAPPMSAGDYTTWRRWAFHNSNPAAFNPGNQPDQTQDQTIFAGSDLVALNNVMKGWANGSWDASKVEDYDWTGLVTQTGVTQTHTLSASGGTDRIQSFVSFGYLKNEGTQIGQDYERYNGNMSTDIQATKWFTMGGSINASWGNQSYGFSRTGQSTSSGPTDIYSAAKQIYRYALPYDEEGTIVDMPGGVNGVYTVIDEWNKSIEKRQTLRALGSFYGNVNFGEIWKPLEGLNYKISFGPDFRYYRKGVYIDSESFARGGGNNYADWEYKRDFSWVLDNILSYTKDISVHHFDITLLQSASKYDYETGRMSGEKIPKPSYLWNNMDAIDITNADSKASISTDLKQSSLVSFGARFNYALLDKYLLTLTARTDGASQLSQGHKWASFPSAALGWRIEQEEFMQNMDWLQQLKLRFGVGVTGNAAVDPYATLGGVRSFYLPFGGANNYLAYATNEPYYFADAVYMANPALTWEKTTQYNLGLDFGFLKGRISGAIDVYQSYTNDLLMAMNIPTLTGYAQTMANVGKTKNKGVEVSLNFIPVQTRSFTWNSSLNTAWQKDEIVELANGKNDMVDNNWFIGESLLVYYGYENAGIWQESDAAEMAKFNEKIDDPKSQFTVGTVRPVDTNDDYLINEKDRKVLGNRMPRWTLGWNNTFNYKGLELNVELYGRLGYMISSGGEQQNGMGNQREIDYWTPENTGAEWQKPIYTGTLGVGGDSYSALLGFKNASYIKFRNVSLGYFLPSGICQKAGLKTVKLYTQLRNIGNLYSSVNFTDLDMNATYYNRGFTFGVEIGF